MTTTDGDAARAIDQALARRDPSGALALLAQAEAAAPPSATQKMQRAMALRMSGDLKGAVTALDQALAMDPYNFLALISKGALVERISGERQAADVYRNALKIAPTEAPPALQGAIDRARQVVAKTADDLEAFLEARLAGLDKGCDQAAKDRFAEGLQVFVGKKKVYNAEPLLLHYPRLPAIPFYDRSLFPWLEELEATTPVIQGELHAALDEVQGDFAPYIAYPPGAPVNQWGELNHSRRWSTYFLWKDGQRQDGACARCPLTAGVLDGLPLAHQPGFAPTAMFSALDARTTIPAHTGSSNVRLIVHLPLILPGPARFRVGNEVKPWKMGQAWVFDDTIEHEAWNDADQLRVILIFDVWNPYLSEGERDLISTMMTARNAFFAQ
jgi:aspartate beta-hydroxylase